MAPPSTSDPHTPAVQVPPGHGAPSGRWGLVHWPVPGSQAPPSWQASSGAQTRNSLARVQYTFLERVNYLHDGTPVGWNYVYNPDPVAGEHWQALVAIHPPNDTLYAAADFAPLFQYE